jgi:hypothetical protein
MSNTFDIIVSDIDEAKSVLVISGNTNESDHRFLKNHLISKLGDVRIIFFNPDDDDQKVVSGTYDAVLIFGFNKKVNYTLHSHALGEKVYIVDDKNQTQYLKWYFNSAGRTSFDLLKQKYTFCSTEQILHLKSVLTETETDVIDADEHQSEEAISNGDMSLESLLKETLVHVSKDNREQDNPADRVHLMFKDATTLSVPANKIIYRYSEDAADLSEMKCHAENLTAGDYIFLVKGNDLDEIIDSMFETDSNLKDHYYHYKIWREDLEKFLFKEDLSCQKFAEIYLTNVIKSSQVVEKWINGDTLMPHKKNFISLLNVMQKKNILTQEVRGIDVYESTRIVKSIRAGIPREIMKMYIAKLNGITYHADIDNETLLGKLYELVDIKKVALVIK